ncbi:DNA primase [Candidatus Kaiserbacteria bacterium RIFCSPHIGHO2_01_FULL_56_24]|uniref:DNA primase n=1 Tax=Candidatus Kaiserbacteria bacterium RIFCSPHIGHO2_01_FULL_56_24 TaxID=1798487 RepID=A0A1F6DBN0_9BACT|nr:MAG: DNA primase [Candidatus Kaiserbacteria bacterium RIFCSPHIGHO2_01_FULL_56_24]
MSDTVQQIKDRLNIVDVVSGYVKLDRAGQNMRARCPFHAERTPSFIVSPDRGTYHCFGCGVGGDMFSFIEAIEGVDFKGALKILAERAGVELVYAKGEKKDDKDRLFEAMEAATIYYQSRLNDEAKEYLTKRGLEQATMNAFRIGFAGDQWSDLSDHLRGKKFTEKEILDAGLAKKGEKGGLTDKFRNRIMFPIADTAGRIVAFSGRTFGANAHPDAPKYLNSPETPLFIKSRILYGFDRAKQTIRKHNFALLVEGQMDLILSHQAGWGNTVAVSGTAFTMEHAALLKRMSENLVIALDADEAGFKAAARAARAALQSGLHVKVAQLPDGLDPADLIVKDAGESWRERIREAKDIITFLLDVLEERAKAKDAFRRAVETAVLPFLVDVQSPIAREQYEKEIAKRLGVSESAVSEARAKLAKATPQPLVKEEKIRPADAPNRIRQAYGLLLWQESMKVPLIDTEEFTRHLEESIGKEMMDELRRMPLEEKEMLRFFAEHLHGKNGSLKRDAATLIRILQRTRLQRELMDNTDALKEAEDAGDEARIEKLSKRSHLLTAEIAKISKEA